MRTCQLRPKIATTRQNCDNNSQLQNIKYECNYCKQYTRTLAELMSPIQLECFISTSGPDCFVDRIWSWSQNGGAVHAINIIITLAVYPYFIHYLAELDFELFSY